MWSELFTTRSRYQQHSRLATHSSNYHFDVWSSLTLQMSIYNLSRTRLEVVSNEIGIAYHSDCKDSLAIFSKSAPFPEPNGPKCFIQVHNPLCYVHNAFVGTKLQRSVVVFEAIIDYKETKEM